MATIKDLEAKIQELREENEKLKNEKKELQDLPSQKETTMKRYEPTRKVTIELFKDSYTYKEPLFVSINGRSMWIKRGVPVQVDEYIADFIEAQKAEEARIMRRVEQEEKEYQENTKHLGA